MMRDADVAVIGAGPAGLAAAAVTGAAGLSTLILDEQSAPGGQIWRQADRVLSDPARAKFFASSFRHAASDIEAARSHAQLISAADVVDISPDRELLWLDRGTQRLHETKARAIVLATGAMERALLLPGWTLPGVMGVGALQIAMKQSGLVPAGPVVLAGQGPLLLLVLRQLLALEADVTAVLDVGAALPSGQAARALPGALLADPRLVGQGIRLAAARSFGNAEVFRGVRGIEALGEGALERVRFEAGGRHHELTASVLGLHDGVVPNTQLSRLLALEHRFRDEDAAFAPVTDGDGATSAEGVWCAGDAAGIGGAALARLRGKATGEAICRALGKAPRTNGPRKNLGIARARPLVEALYKPLSVTTLATEDTVICRCETVTLATIRTAVAAGATGPNRVKTATRCGMGPCQGRICGGPLTRLIAEFSGRSPDDVGALRIRPPIKPLLLGDYTTLAEEAQA